MKSRPKNFNDWASKHGWEKTSTKEESRDSKVNQLMGIFAEIKDGIESALQEEGVWPDDEQGARSLSRKIHTSISKPLRSILDI
jgi:hypothetical protein